MAGVGKLLKQAQKMQRKIEAIQEELAQKELEVSSGGGAVRVKINGQQEITGIRIDPDFLKEDKAFIEETLLAALQDAQAQAKALNEEEMEKATAGFNLPGMM